MRARLIRRSALVALLLAIVAVIAIPADRADAAATGRMSALSGHPYYTSDYSCMEVGNNDSIVNNCNRNVYWDNPLPVINAAGNSYEYLTVSAWAANSYSNIGCAISQCSDANSCSSSGTTWLSTFGSLTTISVNVWAPSGSNPRLSSWCQMNGDATHSGATIYSYYWLYN